MWKFDFSIGREYPALPVLVNEKITRRAAEKCFRKLKEGNFYDSCYVKDNGEQSPYPGDGKIFFSAIRWTNRCRMERSCEYHPDYLR